MELWLIGLFVLLAIVLVAYVYRQIWSAYVYIKEPIKGAILLGQLAVVDLREENRQTFAGAWWDWTHMLRANRNATLQWQQKVRRDFQAVIQRLGGFDPKTGQPKKGAAAQQIVELRRLTRELYDNRGRTLPDVTRMLVYVDDYDGSVSIFIQWGNLTPLSVMGSTSAQIPAELSYKLMGKFPWKLVTAQVDKILEPVATDFYQRYLDVKVEGVTWYYLYPFKIVGRTARLPGMSPPAGVSEAILASHELPLVLEQLKVMQRQQRVWMKAVDDARGINVAQTIREAVLKLSTQLLKLEGELKLGTTQVGWAQLVVAGIFAIIGVGAAAILAPGDIAALFLGLVGCGGLGAFIAMSGKLPLGGG